MAMVNVFTGNLAKAPILTGAGDHAVCKIVVISNEYAGKDRETGESKEVAVSIQFTAFGRLAETIHRNFFKGDQIIINEYRIRNNNYEGKDGETVYGYNFIIDRFEFGQAGREKREHRGE